MLIAWIFVLTCTLEKGTMFQGTKRIKETSAVGAEKTKRPGPGFKRKRAGTADVAKLQ